MRTAAGPGTPAHTSLRAFDLSTGQPRADYPLPGATNLCNDITIGPDGSVYATDTVNGRVLRLTRAATALAIWADDPRLRGADGLTFLGPTLYVNTFTTNHIYRIPIGAAGSAGAAVDIALSRKISGPDGMRAAGGKLYLAENRANRIDELTIDADRASVTVLKKGYDTPTAVSPVGAVLWVGESKFRFLQKPKYRGRDPGPFRAYELPLPGSAKS
jgi:sugar lactone lactonase YvrE